MGSSTVTTSQDKGNRRVIVAENETSIRLDIVEALMEHGFEVVGEAADGEETMKLALRLGPDLMVMDIEIPRLDGVSAADRVMREVPCAIVAFAASSDKELVERVEDTETVAYLVKPLQAKGLIPAAGVALSRHQEMLTLGDSAADLQDRLTARKQVDHAKDLLMERVDLSEPGVFRWVQKTSMDRRSSMHEVADAVIEQLGSA